MDIASGEDAHSRLAQVLQSLRMRGMFYCHAELSGPWALEMPALADSLSFHVVTGGSCWLRLPDSDPLELRAGGLVLVPHGLGHELLSSPEARPALRVDLLPQEYVGDAYSILRHGGAGRSAQLICGVVSFDDPAARELMRRLPRILFLHGDSVAASSAIRDTLRLMASELSRQQPGGEAVATRLADILIFQAIRAWLEGDAEARTGWLLALQDERIGRVLEAMHADPGREWNLDRLARTATMSRSMFSARFTALVGEPPIAYLTRWRMNLAASRLREGRSTVAALAVELGYRSEAAFNRAFTRIIGCTPGSVRRNVQYGQSADTSQTGVDGFPALAR